MSEPVLDADATLPGFHETVLDGLPEAVIVAAPDGVITFVNAAAQTLLGYGAADVVGQPITALVPRQPERRVDPVKWLARWAAEPDVEQSRFLDLTARRRDGREMPVEVRVREGRVGGRQRYFITVRDNTARRHEQIALKDANLRAARILMVAEDAIVSIDADQKLIFFNLAAERMFGYRAEEVLGQPLSILIPWQARAAHEGHVEAFRDSKHASRMMSERSQVKGFRRSGETFPLEATITKVMAAGALTYTAHLRDVTERNRARDALLESERRIRAVFDHAGEAIALLTPAGEVVEINRAGEALTTAERPLIGAPLWEAPWLGFDVASAPAAAERLRAAIQTAAAGEPARMAAELIRDGKPLPIDVRLTPIPDDTGVVAYVLAEGRFEG
ncbi:MAG: PAS domain S-box protein [Caulobacterales bacterium]